MGRDTLLYLFIIIKCTDEYIYIIKIKTENDPDYYNNAHILELDVENPFMKIGDYPVVLISDQNKDSWYICEKFINVYDIEYQAKPIELDLSNLTTVNYSNKLILVTEISF